MQATVKYLEDGDIMYYRFSDEKITRTVERFEHIHVDLDAAGHVVAIEVIWCNHVPHRAVADVFNEFGIAVESVAA